MTNYYQESLTGSFSVNILDERNEDDYQATYGRNEDQLTPGYYDGAHVTLISCTCIKKTKHQYRLTACDLQAFLVFCQHPVWVNCAGIPIESVVTHGPLLPKQKESCLVSKKSEVRRACTTTL